MTRYSIHPIEEHFHQWDEKIKATRNQYWAALRSARNEYFSLVNSTEYSNEVNGFYYFMQHNYGIKVSVNDGGIGGDYEITNPKKFMFFQLKYFQ